MKPGRLYGKGAKGKATLLHSRIVRSRGRCERCGSTENLQCAHVVSRRYSATRTDEHAAMCLCAKCHFFLTNNPYEHVQFCSEVFGVEGYAAIRDKAREGRKVDWDVEVERLRLVAKELGVQV